MACLGKLSSKYLCCILSPRILTSVCRFLHSIGPPHRSSCFSVVMLEPLVEFGSGWVGVVIGVVSNVGNRGHLVMISMLLFPGQVELGRSRLLIVVRDVGDIVLCRGAALFLLLLVLGLGPEAKVGDAVSHDCIDGYVVVDICVRLGG